MCELHQGGDDDDIDKKVTRNKINWDEFELMRNMSCYLVELVVQVRYWFSQHSYNSVRQWISEKKKKQAERNQLINIKARTPNSDGRNTNKFWNQNSLFFLSSDTTMFRDICCISRYYYIGKKSFSRNLFLLHSHLSPMMMLRRRRWGGDGRVIDSVCLDETKRLFSTQQKPTLFHFSLLTSHSLVPSHTCLL